MQILLFGNTGQVGRELEPLLRGAAGAAGRVVALDRAAADVADAAAVRRAIRRERPDLVVNAAAYTAVDRAEAEPELARAVNATSVAAMAEEVARLGGWLVHYSTDYVFDGTKAGAWVETDRPAPLSVYGRTKREGEEAIAASGCRHLVFRTSWVYAAHGANFPRTILRLARERTALAVVDDQVGAPTSAARIATVTCAAVARLAAGRPLEPGLYHLAAAGATSWHGYAARIVAAARAAGAPLAVPPDGVRAIPSAEYPQAARRPANSLLDTTKLRTALGASLPPWEDDLAPVIDSLCRELPGRAAAVPPAAGGR
jgi:dTDP-4-dehydrorhamnose reductase